jgi:hypothetical protein
VGGYDKRVCNGYNVLLWGRSGKVSWCLNFGSDNICSKTFKKVSNIEMAKKWISCFKSSLSLNNDLQNTQTLQLD